MIDYIHDEGGSSRAVVHDSTVYIGTMLARDPMLSPAEQMKQILDEIDDCLKACGTTKRRALYATICCSDTRHADVINSVWDSWVPWHDPPALMMLITKMTNPRQYVSVQLTAAV
jgi:enamine deaminase RidA (YjgF/YER057c/UK114 family)